MINDSNERNISERKVLARNRLFGDGMSWAMEKGRRYRRTIAYIKEIRASHLGIESDRSFQCPKEQL